MPWQHYHAVVEGAPHRPSHCYKSAHVVALFEGQWSDLATASFTEVANAGASSAQTASAAYQAAIDLNVREWTKLEAAGADLFGYTCTSGGCLFLTETRVTCFWLGSTQIVQVRNSAIIARNSPHTLNQALLEAGQESLARDRYRNVCVRSFVAEQQVDSATWSAMPGDRICLLPKSGSMDALDRIAAATGRTPDEVATAALAAATERPGPRSLVMSEYSPFDGSRSPDNPLTTVE